jgi:signal transduction histidine kinase
MRRRQPATAWDAAYGVERDATIVWRLRWAVWLCVLCLVVACTDVAMARPEAGALRLKFLGAFLGLSFIVGLTTLLPDGHRNPRPLAVVFGLGIILTLDLYGLAIPHGIAITGAALCATVMGLAILVPWGTGAQSIVSATAVAAYGGLSLLGNDDTSALFSIVLSGSLVGIVGASLLDRYRRGSYVQAWQQERLAALGHDLAQQEHSSDVAARLVFHATALIPADVCLVAPLVPSTDGGPRVLRVTHVGGAKPALAEPLRGLELPCDSPIVADILRRGVLLMPTEAPASDLGRIIAAQPDVHALYAALVCGAEVLGVLSWIRHRPFAPAERQLAAHLAEPAALALNTVRLLTDLRESSRLKSEFVSTVSHELRTPLNVILGFAEMARDVAFAAPERAVCLDRIEGAGRELLTLIESTLEVGRLEASRSPVRIESVRLAAFWTELGLTCTTIPRNPAVRLEWNDDLPDVAIATDPHKLRVIVRNLVGNALKFTTHGHVRAELRVETGRLVLSVADTGIGIRPEDHRTIFEMFRQADGSDARRFGGTGLGLFIVRRFVEQLGATVDVDSTLGAGATFRVLLPVTPAQDERTQRAA